MQINWLEIIGQFLLAAGGIGSGTYAVRYGWHRMFAAKSLEPVESPTKRSADAGAPPDAIDWVLDITCAMGASHASCVLEALTDGCSRDQARARRIAQLEASKPPEPIVQPAIAVFTATSRTTVSQEPVV